MATITTAMVNTTSGSLLTTKANTTSLSSFTRPGYFSPSSGPLTTTNAFTLATINESTYMTPQVVHTPSTPKMMVTIFKEKTASKGGSIGIISTSFYSADTTNNQKTVMAGTFNLTKGTMALPVASSFTDTSNNQKTINTVMISSQQGGILGPKSNTNSVANAGQMNTYIMLAGGAKINREFWM